MQELDQTKNIRNIIGLDDTELRASMEKSGWIPQFPAFADENGVLIVGHRRMKIAAQLGLTPVVETIHFGNGSEGDTKRLEVAIASNIGAAGLSEKDRQAIAVLAYQHGYTQKQIGKMLGVSQQTVMRDLDKSDLSIMDKLKPAKTATNPKGAGRRRAPKKHDRAPEVVPLADTGLSDAQISKETGLGKRQVRRIIEREQIERAVQPMITPEMLSLTAQQKLDLAIKRYQEKLDAEFSIKLGESTDEVLVNSIGPRLRKEQAHAKYVIQSRKGIMTKQDFKKIWSCLHPDRAMQPTRNTDEELRKIYEEAFNIFSKVEGLLLAEKDKPTQFVHIPKTREEWDEVKRQVSQARANKRRTGKNGNDLKRAD